MDCRPVVDSVLYVQATFYATGVVDGHTVRTLLSPASVVAAIEDPNGVESPLDMIEQSEGVFQGAVNVSAAGKWRGTIKGFGNVDAVKNFSFIAIDQLVGV